MLWMVFVGRERGGDGKLTKISLLSIFGWTSEYSIADFHDFTAVFVNSIELRLSTSRESGNVRRHVDTNGNWARSFCSI